MSNKIVQLENEAGDNIYPLAGGALTGSISKTMLEEGVFEGPELSEPSTVAYVATDNIQNGAVTSDKIDYTTYGNEKVVGKLQDSTTVYEQLLIGNIPSYSTASTVVKLGHIDNVGRIIYMNGWAKRADYWTSMTQQYDNLKSAVQFAQRTGGGVQSGDITFLGDIEYAGAQFSLTIRYTKSG